MSKLGPRNEFCYIARSEGKVSVTNASIQIGHPVEGTDIEDLRRQLENEFGTSFVFMPSLEAPKIP